MQRAIETSRGCVWLTMLENPPSDWAVNPNLIDTALLQRFGVRVKIS